jgi:cytidylate kinase
VDPRRTEEVIFAIFGATLVGKSVVATMLANRLALTVRHCGDEVREAATVLNCSVSDLPMNSHERIDNETLQWVRGRHCIVEGRYLDHVLTDARDPVFLVELRASLKERERRAQATGSPGAVGNVHSSDEADDAFRERCYGASHRVQPQMMLETTNLSVETCVACIEQVARSLM